MEITLPKPFKRKCDGIGDLEDSSLPNGPPGLEKELLAGEDLLAGTALDALSWEADIPANNRGPNPPVVPFETELPPSEKIENIDAVEEGCRIKLSGEHLIIDKYGVSGTFGITGQAPLASGALMDGKWSWSLNHVQLTLVKSSVQGFGFGGGLVVPIAKKDQPLDYTAELQFFGDQPTYDFQIELTEKMEFPLFKAIDVTIKPNSQINITVEDNNFKASAALWGEMAINNSGESDENGAKVPSIEFNNLQLSTSSPHIGGAGTSVFLKAGGAGLNDFPIQISGIGLKFGGQPGGNFSSVALKFSIGLNLMEQGDCGLTASGGFEIWGKMESNVLGAHEWKFDKFLLSDVSVLINLPAVKGCGALTFFKNDDTYGNGFSAFLQMAIMGEGAGQCEEYVCGGSISGAFTLSMAAVFGNKDGMRYFMIDGFVGSDKLSIPIPPTPLALTGFGGGVFYRMKPHAYHEPDPNSNSPAIPAGMDTSGLIYKPDPGTLFGLKFAVGFATTGGDASPLDGKLSCIVRFGPGLSLQNIMFWGVAEIINPIAGIPELPDISDEVADSALEEDELQQKDTDEAKVPVDKIAAKMGMSLDFEAGFSFHAYAEVFMSVAQGKIKGNGTFDLLIHPDPYPAYVQGAEYPDGRWHLFVGGYESPPITVPGFFNPADEITLLPNTISLDYAGITVVAKSYFLLGNDIPGPPDLEADVAEFFDISQNTNNRDLLSTEGNDPAKGTGVAFGASLAVTLNKKVEKKIPIINKKVKIVDIKITGKAGFDIALLKYKSDTKCNISADFQTPHGLNGFRAFGRIYAFVNVNGKILFYPLPNIGVGLMFQADIPDPSYFQILAVLNFKKKWEFNFEVGKECGTPLNP